MRSRRGLTLIEMLIATAIMAALAAACVPLLREAAAIMERPRDTAGLHELAMLADEFVGDPARFGFDPAGEHDELELPGGDEKGAAVRVRRFMSKGENPSHIWLVFEQGPLAVSRCAVIEPAFGGDEQ